MPKYSYTVINQEGQKLTGTVEADSEALARDSLNKLGFPILDVTQVNEEAAEQIIGKSLKFEFQAVDSNARKVIGTIAAEDKYGAFKRLINEYHFAVEYLYLTSLSNDAKEEEKRRGVLDLYTALKQEEQHTSNPTDEKEAITREENEKIIIQQADFVLEKVAMLTRDFTDIIKPEDLNTIQKKADRLIRLKTSKNIDYVKHLAEDLLVYIQNQEIFLTKEKSDKKLQSFRMDMKRLMNDIHREKIGVSWDQQILTSINEWNTQHITTNTSPNWWEKLTKDILDFVQNILEEPPEVTVLKDKIRIINQQIWDYYKMYFKESTMETRAEIKESLRTLKEQKNELKLELSAIKKKIDEEEALEEKETTWDKISSEVVTISGWFFGIYFLLHGLSSYLANKKLPINLTMPFAKVTEYKSFYITMLILLIVHAGFQVRILASLKKTWENILLFPLVTVSILLVVFNF